MLSSLHEAIYQKQVEMYLFQAIARSPTRCVGCAKGGAQDELSA